MIERENVEANLHYLVAQYSGLVELLLAKKGNDGISRLSKSDMAAHLGISQTAISKRLKKFIHFGLIEKSGIAGYRVIHTDFMETPLGRVFDLLTIIEATPNLSYEQQAKELGVSVHEIEMIYGYLVYLLN
ncbi:helix-turn-helix domain-containing protein [Paenibacillus piri]|uniref:Helix-turn-helix domain-containing protein n=1 Tax=Paenibacillus piri TaxID=2547395 RepID=A0A4R5KWT1_9BACL|nr:helix-turn-helix domain-containing protein [Paenibacillus piri]TDF99440.1 helix-turn-helix domain-containing protein [Paenibacillus piri]